MAAAIKQPLLNVLDSITHTFSLFGVQSTASEASRGYKQKLVVVDQYEVCIQNRLQRKN